MSEDKRRQDAMKFFAELATNGGNIDAMEKLNYIRLCWNSAIDMQAEIEWLKKELRDNNYQAVRQIIPAEMAAEDGQLEIQRLNAECNKLDTECNKWVKRLREKEEGFAITLRHMSIQIERKDKLIEQMRETLAKIAAQKLSSEMSASDRVGVEDCYEDAYEYVIRDARAALSAAERGE